MNPKLKSAAYGMLLILAAWFAAGFYSKYSAVVKAEAAANAPAPAAQEAGTNNSTATNGVTNLPPQTTNVAAAPSSNPPPAQTNTAAQAQTNAAPPAQTNTAAPAQTNTAASIQTNTAAPAQPMEPVPAPDESSARGAMIGYLAAFVGTVIGLGLLIAADVTQFFGDQAVNYLFNDVAEGSRDPEYERAEQEWVNGKYLDAIQMMRDYLKKNPRELHAALRIAEIYEKDLRNSLAAALEYEEVLKHKLPNERWGWAAIHLCNLYSKLGQPDKALELLRRIADEYPRTAAAKKARARLGLAELEDSEARPEPAEEPFVQSIEAPPVKPEPPPPPPTPPEPPKSNLPPGFRPKE